MGKRYRVIRDLQGGSFGMGRDYTADEWREQAYEWTESDGGFETEEDSNEYKENLAKMNDEELIDYIQDLWELEMEECDRYEIQEVWITHEYYRIKEHENGTLETIDIDDRKTIDDPYYVVLDNREQIADFGFYEDAKQYIKELKERK